jgi:hypothetical protein
MASIRSLCPAIARREDPLCAEAGARAEGCAPARSQRRTRGGGRCGCPWGRGREGAGLGRDGRRPGAAGWPTAAGSGGSSRSRPGRRRAGCRLGGPLSRDHEECPQREAPARAELLQLAGTPAWRGRGPAGVGAPSAPGTRAGSSRARSAASICVVGGLPGPDYSQRLDGLLPPAPLERPHRRSALGQHILWRCWREAKLCGWPVGNALGRCAVWPRSARGLRQHRGSFYSVPSCDRGGGP